MRRAIYDVHVSDKKQSNGFYQWIVFKDGAYMAQGREFTEVEARLEAGFAVKDDIIYAGLNND